MSRFGLLAKRCKRQDLRKLDLVQDAVISEHSFTIYKNKIGDKLFLRCLNTGYWYQLKYKPMLK